jgi:ribosomal protein L11 methyltransferase
MEWLKAKVNTTPYGAEILTAILLENNIVGAEIINPIERVRHLNESSREWDYADENLLSISCENVYLVFYVTKDRQGATLLEKVKKDIEGFKSNEELGSLELEIESADDENWLYEWKKHFKPFKLGKIVIVPQWLEYEKKESDEIIFTIDPGSAFGTGQHATTKLCISALQKYLENGDKVLDIGCGSGILSIISLLLGASGVFACDIDPAGAIATTKKNAKLNGIDIDRLRILSGDALSDESLRAEIQCEKYNVVVANIVADIVMELIPFVKEIMAHDGVFIASGIIDERAEDVMAVFNGNKMKIIEKFEQEGWFCFVGKA